MAKSAFDSIEAGLKEALAFAQGDTGKAKAHTVEVPTVDVAAARKRLKLSQDKFAQVFNLNASTLRKWEQGKRRPTGPALALMQIIEKEPEAALRALNT